MNKLQHTMPYSKKGLMGIFIGGAIGIALLIVQLGLLEELMSWEAARFEYIAGLILLAGLASMAVATCVCKMTNGFMRSLRSSERLYQTILENISDVVFVMGSHGEFEYVSPNAAAVWEMSIDTITEQSPQSLLGEAVVDSILDTGSAGLINVPVNIVDGKRVIKHLLVSSTPLKLGTDKQILVTCHDVTEQQVVEAQLESRENLFRTVVRASRDAIIALDEGGISVCNPAGCLLLGVAQEAILGKNLNAFLTPQSVELLRKSMSGVSVDSGESEQYGEIFELTVVRSDGKEFPVEVALTVTESSRGQLVVAVMRDISIKKKFELELLQAKETAEEANSVKSEFLANMSHEIRTPLNGLLGMLQLLKIAKSESDRGEYTDVAIQSGKRLSRLLSDILDISKVEAGKLDLQNERFCMTESMRAVEQLFSASAITKGIGLSVNVDPAIPPVLLGDADRLQQVLGNLVGNAIKYTTAGRVSVDVYALSPLQTGYCRVLFTVSDSGIGIPDDRLGDIFNPFVQCEFGYNRQFQGAGLGLAICKNLVELMGGTITVSSMEGEGTTICIALSFPVGGDEKPEAHETVLPAARHGERTLSILVVEDDNVSRLFECELLKSLGHRVTAVLDGAEAVQRISEESFDLVFMDIQMPVMNGVEATHAIRTGAAGENNRTIPIIALTAYAMAGDKEKLLGTGINDYLAKPVGDLALKAILERYSTGKSAA